MQVYFLRLRGILGKKTGHEDDMASSFAHDFDFKKTPPKRIYEFNEDDKKEFLKGAKLPMKQLLLHLLVEKLQILNLYLTKMSTIHSMKP